MPYTDRGVCLSRRHVSAADDWKSFTLSANSIHEPIIIQAAAPTPMAGKIPSTPEYMSVIAIAAKATIPANHSVLNALKISPRFQESKGPTTIAPNIGTINGPKVALKYGGPTETFPASRTSKNNGYKVPRSTVSAATDRNKLFKSRPPSRLMGRKRPPG